MWMSSTRCQTTSRLLCGSPQHSWTCDSALTVMATLLVSSLQVKKKNSEESSTQWTTGIAEVQLPIEYVLSSSFVFLFGLKFDMVELNILF
jgi:hypothetical protein